MNKIKIINDPVHGIIRFRDEIIYDIIDHPYFQRLRRIKQMGFSNIVYPGANHTRFEHAIGAAHLMQQTLFVLRQKGIEISDEEFTASTIAILCHDLGHGPFSHALEFVLLPISHEELTIKIMESLANEFGPLIDQALSIFKGEYHKRFLCQLVSGQLDLDRLDYLARDSFFTGVVEGKVGYERLIMMMNVRDGELVIEEKGVPSVEKFLLSRHLMYSQVYHHKTALATEQMLKLLVFECISTINSGGKVCCSENLLKLINNTHIIEDNAYETIIQYFTNIDDIDIMYVIKSNVDSDNPVIKILCNSLLKRKLFRVYLHLSSTDSESAEILKKKLSRQFSMDSSIVERLFIGMNLNLKVYAKANNPLFVLKKSGEVVEFSEMSHILAPANEKNEFLVIAPKEA